MINLFTDFYVDPDAARDAELRECRRRNAANPSISRIIQLADRPTFQETFQEVNRESGPADINIVANADIFFDESISLVDGLTFGEVYALTRWDVIGDCKLQIFADDNGVPRVDSQDAWIWRGHCSVTGADFTAGVRGCDNHLTYLFHQAGYRVSNPSKSIRAIHLHQSEIRRYGHDAKDCVPKPYLLVAPHELGEVPRLDVRF